MLFSALLALSVLSVPGFAEEAVAPPAPQLLRLESMLTQQLDVRKQGNVSAEQYRAFVVKFRAELDEALSRAPQTAVNQGRHALILSRLDELGAGDALAGLDRALSKAPDDPALINAKGSIQLEQGDYQGALASANAVLKYNQEHGQPPDPEAVSLRQFSKDRRAPTSGSRATPAAPPNPAVAAGQNGRAPIQFTPRPERARVEVPSFGGEIMPVDAGPGIGDRSSAWAKTKVEQGQHKAVQTIDRILTLEPGEEGGLYQAPLTAPLVGSRLGSD